MLQGQRDMNTVAKMILSELAPLVNAQQGVFYINDSEGEPLMKLLGGYAFNTRKNVANEFQAGEGWSVSARWRRSAFSSPTCRPNYVQISSGLGEATPLQHRGPAGSVRRRSQGGDRAGLVQHASATLT